MQARLDWLARNAVPLTTVEAEHGLADLAPLRAMIGDASVVGLGEGTHGTREHFQAKHRLLEFLVREMGFTIFSIEANLPEAYALDAYVHGADGDVNALIAGMYFWTWNTEEVRAMVEWMRAYNLEQRTSGGRALHFTGFDMQTVVVALRVVRGFLEQHDAPWFDSGGEAVLDALASFNPQIGRSMEFGCATGTLPVEALRGKHVRLRGWIKTEALENGWAGLWLRVDGPTPWFDNMNERGLNGTAEWEQREIALDVPGDASAIYFGLVMPGTGKAWFDDLALEVDGRPWRGDEFDFGFESAEPIGLVPADPSGGPPSESYVATHDTSAARTGARSFMLASLDVDDGPERMSAAARDLVTHMESARERYASGAEPDAVEWAIQNARVVRQWAELATDPSGGFAHRDACMAENVAWILEQDPGAKIVLWAHNWHVRDEVPFMGSHLRERFGASYVNLAFCSSHGTYTAMAKDGGVLGTHTLQTPPPDSFEATLEAVGRPLLLVDLRRARADDPGSAWLTESHPFGGLIGAEEMPEHYSDVKLQGHFDLLLWVKDTSASRPLTER